MEKKVNEIRTFIAIDLSTDILKKLDLTCRDLNGKVGNASVRWAMADNIHLTLKFLGDTPISYIEKIKGILNSVTDRFQTMDIQIGDIGTFPSIQKPRIIWVGVQAPGELSELQKAIDIEIHSLGFARENRPFSAHLTIGRVAKNVSILDLKTISQVVRETKIGVLGVSKADKVNLYKSDLKPTGAVYTCLYSALLHSK